MAGLTTLFGMGRGEHRRQYHHKMDVTSVTISRHIGSAISFKKNKEKKIKAYVQLVLLGFDVTTFTPIAYQRGSLPRHLKVNSS